MNNKNAKTAPADFKNKETKSLNKAKGNKTRIILFNNSNSNAYIDLDGKKSTDDIIVLGPRGMSAPIWVENKRVIDIPKENKNIIVKGA